MGARLRVQHPVTHTFLLCYDDDTAMATNLAHSGLKELKRRWSGSWNDLNEEEGSAGVVGIKAKKREQGPWPDSTNTSAQGSSGRSYEAEMLDEWGPVSLTPATITKSGTRQDAETGTYEVQTRRTSTPSSHASFLAAETAKKSGFVKASTLGKEADSTQRGRTLEAKSRQLPSSFGKGKEEKRVSRGGWSKSASELKASSEKLPFLVKGSETSASLGRRTLEADRRISKIFLSKEQQVVHEMVVNGGKSMFFTGSAGE